jgi:hypothetical protein
MNRSPRGSDASMTVPSDWAHLIDYSETPWDLPQATEPLRKRSEHRHERHIQRRRRRSQARMSHDWDFLSPTSQCGSGGRSGGSHQHTNHTHPSRSPRRSEGVSPPTMPAASSRTPKEYSTIYRGQKQNASQVPNSQWIRHNPSDNHSCCDSPYIRSTADHLVVDAGSKNRAHSFRGSMQFVKQLTSKLPWHAGSDSGTTKTCERCSGEAHNTQVGTKSASDAPRSARASLQASMHMRFSHFRRFRSKEKGIDRSGAL